MPRALQQTPGEVRAPYDPLVSTVSVDSSWQLRARLTKGGNDEMRSQVSPAFTKFMACVIILWAVRLGVEAQWHQDHHEVLADVYFALDITFAVLFAGEIVIKLAILRGGFFAKPWNILDVFLTAAAIVDLWQDCHPDGAKLEHTKLMSTLRFLRVIRLIRILKSVEELVMVVEGITKAMTSVFWVMFLLFLVVYMFGVFVTMELSKDEALGEKLGDMNYFGDLQHSMLTLIDIALLVEWPEIIRPIMTHRPMLLPPFLAFMTLSTFGVMNILIGVIVDNTTEARAEMEKNRKRQNLLQASLLWEESLHKKGLGREELRKHEGRASYAGKLQERRDGIMDVVQQIIDRGFIDFPQGLAPEDIVHLLDFDGNAELNHEEFLTGLSRLLLGNEFQLTCLTLTLMGKMRSENRELTKALDESVNERLDKIEDRVNECLNKIEALASAPVQAPVQAQARGRAGRA